MLTRIFDLEEGRVKINENCYLIPELNAIIEKYEDPVPALAYVYFMVAPDSPYANLEKDEKAEIVNHDYPGEFSLEDEEIENAMVKLEKLMFTRTQRIHRAAGVNLDRMAKDLEEQEITHGYRDGNADTFLRIQKELPKLMENYNKLTKMAVEEQQQKLRGTAQAGMY